MQLTFAPHVEFDAEKHEYWYEGQKLSGVTGLIARKLRLKMPEEFVEEHRMEGIHVHKAVQKWIETGVLESVHSGVNWLTKSLYTGFSVQPAAVYSEVLVSDFKRYASAVDIVIESEPGGPFYIYDIKKGSFKRDYVTWQLSIYKYLIERYAGREVTACLCICMKDREYYNIFPKSHEQVEKLLYESVGYTPTTK
jgi:hypothetical protein